jgi:hypothetical protein
VYFQFLHCISQDNWKEKTSYADYRISIAQQLLESVKLPEYSLRGRPSSSTTPIRLQAKTWAHFPMHIPSTEKKKVTKRCVMCYRRAKRSESVWQCKKCGVALHIEECFVVYHTQQSLYDTCTGEFRLSILCIQNSRKNLYWLIFYYFLDVTMPLRKY